MRYLKLLISLRYINKQSFHILSFIFVTAILTANSYLWACTHSVNISAFPGWAGRVIYFPILFILGCILVGLVHSVFYVSKFVDQNSHQVNIRGILHFSFSHLSLRSGIVVSMTMGAGIIGCANLTEIYRATTSTWYDSLLWRIEETLFLQLINSWLNIPSFWDKVYFSLWPFVFMALSAVFRICPIQKFIEIALAVVISFYLTRCINLLFPTAGPAFYMPELFELSGADCKQVQEMLRLYMVGEIPQNGLMPGTMAMPSLHVGLMAIGLWCMASIWKWTLWMTIPWFLLVWMSTIMLGWHYALDGIGGVAVVTISGFIAHYIVSLWDLLGTKFLFPTELEA